MKRVCQPRRVRASSSSPSVSQLDSLRNRRVLAAAVLSAAAALGVASVRAADLSWSADGQIPAGGGHGAWNTTDLRWHDGSFFMAWPNTTADVANFAGSGSLFVPAAINADRLNFNGDYRLYIPQLGIASAANLSTITLGSGIINTGSSRVEIQNNLAGTSGLTKNGSGMLILHGSQAGLTGAGAPVNVNAGTLAYGNTSVADFPSNVVMNVAAGAAIDMGNWTGGGFFTDTVGNIQGGGNIYLGTAQNLGVTVGSALIAGATGGSVEFSGTMSGGGRFSKVGTGTTVFSGTNTYTGATSVEAGTLRLVNSNAISDQNAVFLSNVAGVTLQLGSSEKIGSLGGGGTLGGVVDIGANTLTVGTDNTYNGFGGNLVGTGLVVKAGTGQWAIQNATPVSAFAGTYRIDDGVLSFRQDNRMGAIPGGPNGAYITLNGGVLANSVSGGFAMDASRGITTTADSGIAVYGVAASSLSVQGSLTGSHTITKTGIGTLNLTADNGATFTGDWVVRDGGLMTNNNANTGIGAPFGTGGIDIESANFNVMPAAAAGNVYVNVARGGGETFAFGPGTVMRLDRGTGASLVLHIDELVRKPNGTMVVQAAQGAGNLGTSTGEILTVSVPVATTNGLIPGVFLSTSPAATVGDFAGYSGTNGVALATYTSTDLSTSLSSDVVNQTTPLTLTGPAVAFAVRVGNGTAGTALNLGGNSLGFPSGAFSDPAMLIINTASTVSNGTVDFTARRGMVYAQGAAGAVSATITGSGGLSKVGAGPLVLASPATYTGDTDINGGTVQLNVNNAMPIATSVRLFNNGAINLNGNQQTLASLNSDSMNANINMGVNGQLTVGAGDMRYLGTITNGAGATSSTITKDGAGRLTLGFDLSTVNITSPTLAYNKLVIRNGGVVNVSASASLPAASLTAGVALPDTFTLDGGTLRISSVNSAAFGSGGASTYTLSGSDATLRGMTLGAGGGTIEVSEAKEIVLWQRNNAEATGASLLNGSGTLHKTGPGFLRLGVGNDNFTGKIVVHGGNLQFQTDQAVGAGIGNALGPAPATPVNDQLTLDGGMIQTNGSGVIAATRGITIGPGGGSINNAGGLTFNNAFFGAGPMYIIQGNATGGRLARFVAKSSDYSGTVNLLNGMADVVNDNPLGTGQLNLTPQFPIALSKTSGVDRSLLPNAITLGTGSTIDIRVDGGVGSLILAGNISGPGGFSKSKIGAASNSTVAGQGTLVLSGGNSFSGDVFVQTGALVVVQNDALGTAAGATVVSPGASLVFEHLHHYSTPEPMWIAGTGVGGAGALINQGGESELDGPVIAYQDATIGVAAGVDSGFRVGPVRGASHVTKIGGGELSAQHYRVDRLTINEGTAAVTQRGSSGEFAGTSRVKQLAIAGGATLDLTNNAFVIDYDAVSPLPIIRTQIASAYNGGAWDQPGITSSLANASQIAVGYAEASSLTTVPPAFGTVDSTSVLFRHTRYGDADLNGLVNLADFNRLAANFGSTTADWSQGDFDYNGNVNLGDFNKLASNFGLSAAGPTVTPQDWARLGAAVPEPTGIGAIVLGSAALLGGRRGARRRGR